ncbi:hypothetical protein GCM10011380_03550 [Sphingomonas metalli]|uniref:Uncharacterized protein n=1 Tax=Sphingomonas metalli TaxID=1779358 RepID=A0A916SUU2_9SPHN|nr:hypothetical protein GCM10011380_03550 [Sphingomonas metalli]
MALRKEKNGASTGSARTEGGRLLVLVSDLLVTESPSPSGEGLGWGVSPKTLRLWKRPIPSPSPEVEGEEQCFDKLSTNGGEHSGPISPVIPAKAGISSGKRGMSRTRSQPSLGDVQRCRRLYCFFGLLYGTNSPNRQ